MCGIFAYIGKKEATKVCLEGLKKLEYRGYDSAGIAGVKDGQILICKEAGKVSIIEKLSADQHLELPFAIAHTRWATHGIPSPKNAHPHMDQKGQLAVVHNGVVENYAFIKEVLTKKYGIVFSSDTDTEVIAQLVGIYYKGDFLKAAIEALSALEGSFAVAIIHKNHPDQIVATAEKSPLVIGYDPQSCESYIASDPNALAGMPLELYFLENRQVVVIMRGKKPSFYDAKGKTLIKKSSPDLQLVQISISKGIYEHFMLKEIFEQDKTVADAMKDRFDEKHQTAFFAESSFTLEELSAIKHIIIVGCGTSYHAASVGSYFFEEMCRISTRAEIASEYRYKTPIVFPDSLMIALSQSGETADTIAAMRNMKAQGCKILALCNVKGSTLAREADTTIFLHAGPEIAVASTKTFTSQVTVLYLLALLLGRQRGMTPKMGLACLKDLHAIPGQIDEILHNHRHIQEVAIKYAKIRDFYFLGRGVLYPMALEAALKLKEIAYINAVGYPAGEMKHGPIALLDSTVPVGVFCANARLEPKVISNLMESKARGAPIIVLGWKEFERDFVGVADDILFIPKTSDSLACIAITVVTQLFAYYMAKERGAAIDQPRNLAKSVTVE